MNDVIEYWDSTIVARHVKIYDVVEYFNSIGKRNINYIDIGANVGKVYDLLNEQIGVNKGILVEPNRDLFQYMVNKYASNPSITLIEKGITKENGSFEFVNYSDYHIDQGKTDSLNLGLNRISGNTEAYESNYIIEGVTGLNFLYNLNSIPPTELDYIKIDTENCDFYILKSILPYLQENNIRPYISFEVNYKSAPEVFLQEEAQAILDMYAELNYKPLNLNEEHGGDLNLIPLS